MANKLPGGYLLVIPRLVASQRKVTGIAQKNNGIFNS
jgi:hypothetical protein